jgi:nicotinamide riboside transporter PnuC
MILDVVAGILEVVNALSVWRFLTCFAPTVALALFLFISIPEKATAITLSIVPLIIGAVMGTWWERAARRKQRNLAKDQSRPLTG